MNWTVANRRAWLGNRLSSCFFRGALLARGNLSFTFCSALKTVFFEYKDKVRVSVTLSLSPIADAIKSCTLGPRWGVQDSTAFGRPSILTFATALINN